MGDDDVLAVLAVKAWEGPVEDAERARALAALEDGRVLYLPTLSFALAEGEKRFLTPSALGSGRKNISFDPQTRTCQGSAFSGEEAMRLGAMLDRFARQATALVETLAPAYRGMLRRARTSFRPAEIENRRGSLRQDDRLLHVDAFPTRPNQGERILRVFTNVAPDGSERRWQVGEPFTVFARKFLPRIGEPWPGASWLLERLGLTKGRRSEYDWLMLKLHDSVKRDRAYQTGAPRAALSFPPGATWLVFTDQVLHAALAGRFALEQTFHLPVAAMARPERAPLRVLESLVGRQLAPG